MKTVSLLLALMLAATSLAAHDTWLADDGKGALHLTSGMAFPALDYAIKPERVAQTWGRVGTSDVTLEPPQRQKHSLRYGAPTAKGEAAAFAVQLKPKTLELSEREVEHYLDEIHAAPALRELWSKAAVPRRWREEYVKHTKTLVPNPSGCGPLFAKPLGLDVEILPERDPCLSQGGAISIRIVRGGVPVAGLALAAVDARGQERFSNTTDAEGRVQLPPLAPGRWLLRATELLPSAREGLDWQSDFTTLTFTVLKP